MNLKFEIVRKRMKWEKTYYWQTEDTNTEIKHVKITIHRADSTFFKNDIWFFLFRKQSNNDEIIEKNT